MQSFYNTMASRRARQGRPRPLPQQAPPITGRPSPQPFNPAPQDPFSQVQGQMYRGPAQANAGPMDVLPGAARPAPQPMQPPPMQKMEPKPMPAPGMGAPGVGRPAAPPFAPPGMESPVASSLPAQRPVPGVDPAEEERKRLAAGGVK